MLYGIDVSNNNGAVDWTQVKSAGIAFAGIKLSEGTGFLDPTFVANWAGARAQGIMPIVYHFARPDFGNTPGAEAAYFLSLLPALEPGDAVALDLERGGIQGSGDWALPWLATVEHALGFAPLLYSYPDYITHYLTDAALGAYPLWLASYGSLPASIGPWSSVALWQYSETLTVPGIAGFVDGDQLERDLAGLHALGKPALSTRIAAIAACALKPTPDHTSPSIADIPAGGQGIDLGRRQTTNGEIWAYIQWRDQYGWVLLANLRPV